MKNKCFIGLGVMGSSMATHIRKGGYPLSLFNRTEEKSKKWVRKHGGISCKSPAEAALHCDMVFLCVGKDEDVRSVLSGDDGVLQSLQKGSIVVDHTTTSATLAKEMGKVCLKKEIFFLDAPVSGGQVGAEEGKLTVMAGGDQKAFKRSKKVVDLYSKSYVRMGDIGSGQLTKMVNQICLVGLIQSLAEGIHFSKKAGLDTKKVIKVISQGAAQSWQMDNRWQTMLKDDYEHGFAVDWMRKDLGIAMEEGKRNNSKLDLVKLVDKYYSEIQKINGRFDTSSLLKRLDSA